MMTLRRAVLLLALVPTTWSTWSSAQPSESAQPIEPSSSLDSKEQTSSAGSLGVNLQLNQTSLSRAAILQALKEEFRVPMIETSSTTGLLISVDARQLHVSYRDDAGKVVEREMALPIEESGQLDTIALLAGNLARDEGGELLAQLQAAQAANSTTPEVLENEDSASPASDDNESPVQPSDVPSAAPAAEPSSDTSKPPVAPPSEAPDTSKPPVAPAVPLRELEEIPFSASFAGSLAFPPKLREKRTHFEVGLVHSNLGAVEGIAGNVLTLRNQGLDTKNGSKGIQFAGLWLGSAGTFKGVSAAGLVNHHSDGSQGAQGAGLVAIQTGGMKGVQAAGLVSVVGEKIRGVQLAGLSSNSWGGVDGVQATFILALNRGSLRGVQLGGIAVHSSGDVRGLQLSMISTSAGGAVDGSQLALVNVARSIDGSQLGIANVAYQGLEGFQLGITNVAGDFKGTQVGLVNVGGRGKGGQFALVNVARDLEGTAIAPVNIIPGARNQLISYVSYSPDPDLEGLPAGPMTHVAIRVLPGLIYTQANFGLGVEAKECTDESDSSTCIGGSTEYAAGLAIGVRLPLVGDLHAELDLQYQFEKAFSSSSNLRHAILGRAALSYQLMDCFALFAGAGPRLNLKSGPAADPDPEASWDPHFFGGIQVF